MLFSIISFVLVIAVSIFAAPVIADKIAEDEKRVGAISGFISEFNRNRLTDFDIEKLYYNFPPYNELKGRTDVPDAKYFDRELEDTLPEFLKIESELSDIAHIVTQGESVEIDECRIEFIYTYHDGLFSNLMNDASLVFSITTPNKKVLFLRTKVTEK